MRHFTSSRRPVGAVFVWLVNKDSVTWQKIEISTRDLEREVAALRCGLDATQWVGDAALTCLDKVNNRPEPRY